ncbi:hypothetical protein D3C73_1197860 [compost metagenome]
MCSIPWIRSLADRQGCSGLRDRIIDSIDDEYDSCPLSSRTQGGRHGSHGACHHGRSCHRASFVGVGYRYLTLAMAVLHGDSCRIVFDHLCIHLLKECYRNNQAKGRSFIHCYVNRRVWLCHLRFQPDWCLGWSWELQFDCHRRPLLTLAYLAAAQD